MTNFGEQPPQYGAPQYGAPQYGAPQYGAPGNGPQYGAPQYGANPYVQPQYGQPQYGQPQYVSPYGAPQAPTGATAITAAVLSILGGVWHVVGIISGIYTVVMFTSIADYDVLPGYYYAFEVINLLGVTSAAAALLAGGIMLLMRKMLSRTLIAVGCVIALVIQWVGVIAAAAAFSGMSYQDVEGLGEAVGALTVLMAIFASIFPIATVVVTYLRPTLLWLQAPRRVATAW